MPSGRSDHGPPGPAGPFRASRTERADTRPLRRVVLGWGPTAERGSAHGPVRGVRAATPQPPDPLLFEDLPVQVPRSLLLGFRAFLRDAERPLPLPDLRDEAQGPGARRRPHRRDRSGRGRARVLEPPNGLPAVPSGKDSCVHGRCPPASGGRSHRRWVRAVSCQGRAVGGGCRPAEVRKGRSAIASTSQMYPDDSLLLGRSVRASAS